MKREIIKPFDLEKAKAGAKLGTRNGKSVEILKWDARGDFPIKGIIKEEEQDLTACWNSGGFWRRNNPSHSFDLVIVEEVEEPKFKVKDWITNGKYTYRIEEVIGNCYKYSSNKDSISFESISTTDKNYHLWTIRDAKPGDVLITKYKDTFIFKAIRRYAVYDYCGLYSGKFSAKLSIVNNGTTDYVPATKEQRDLLFKKMKEEGYEWDEDALKLKKISNETEEQQFPDTIKIKQIEDGTVVIAGLNNLQYDVINNLIMSWNIIDHPANKK